MFAAARQVRDSGQKKGDQARTDRAAVDSRELPVSSLTVPWHRVIGPDAGLDSVVAMRVE